MDSTLQLTPSQRSAVRDQLLRFRRYVRTPGFTEDLEARRVRTKFFQDELPKRLKGLSVADVIELLSHLWAAKMWGNKDFLAQQIIEDNGADKLAKALGQLLDRQLPVTERYEAFSKGIKRLGGPASVTEMLCYIQPKDCGMWNQVARQGLKVLGIDQVNTDAYRLTAKDYERYNRILALIGKELLGDGLEEVDLLIVDFFLYEVAMHSDWSEPKPKPVAAGKFDHDEVRDTLQSIGEMLGFQAETEVPIARGAKVDVVWRAKIGNLGMVAYVFEVQSGGAIDSLVMNLAKAMNVPSVQKVVAVSDEIQLKKIRSEAEGIIDCDKHVGFWPVEEVLAVSKALQTANESISKLGLIQGI